MEFLRNVCTDFWQHAVRELFVRKKYRDRDVNQEDEPRERYKIDTINWSLIESNAFQSVQELLNVNLAFVERQLRVVYKW